MSWLQFFYLIFNFLILFFVFPYYYFFSYTRLHFFPFPYTLTPPALSSSFPNSPSCLYRRHHSASGSNIIVSITSTVAHLSPRIFFLFRFLPFLFLFLIPSQVGILWSFHILPRLLYFFCIYLLALVLVHPRLHVIFPGLF